MWLAYLYSNDNVTMNYVETVPVVNFEKDYFIPGKLVCIYYERAIVWNVALSLSL